MVSKSGGGGRPRHGEHVKSVPIGIRTDPELRMMIETAADQRGVSLTQEVERRLRASLEEEALPIRSELLKQLEAEAKRRGISAQHELERRIEESFDDEDLFGGQQTWALARLIGVSVPLVEMQTGKKWHEDYHTWASVKASVDRLLNEWEPERPEEQADPEDTGTESALFNLRLEMRRLQMQRTALIETYPEIRAWIDAAQAASPDDEELAPRGVPEQVWSRIETITERLIELEPIVEELARRREATREEQIRARSKDKLLGARTANLALDKLGLRKLPEVQEDRD